MNESADQRSKEWRFKIPVACGGDDFESARESKSVGNDDGLIAVLSDSIQLLFCDRLPNGNSCSV